MEYATVPPEGVAPTFLVDVHPIGHRKHYVKKTDISGGIAVAVVAPGRAVLPGGDVCALFGWSIVEDAGVPAAAMFRLHDGKDATTEVLATVKLAASGQSFFFTSEPPIEVATGRIFIEVVAGSVEGVIYWI